MRFEHDRVGAEQGGDPDVRAGLVAEAQVVVQAHGDADVAGVEFDVADLADLDARDQHRLPGRSPADSAKAAV